MEITVDWSFSRCKKIREARSHLIISAFDNKGISLASHNVDLGDEKAVDVPVEEEYKRCELFNFLIRFCPLKIPIGIIPSSSILCISFN